MAVEGLPEIPQVKQGLADSSLKKSSTFTPDFSEETALDRKSRPSTASSDRGERSSSSGGALIFPSPPPGPPRPKTSFSPSRRSLDCVFVSKSELEKTDKTLSSLRSESIHMQAQIRELHRHKQDFVKLQTACGDVGKVLGCSLEGCTPSTTQDVLQSRVNTLLHEHHKAMEDIGKCQSELEHCRGEIAATNVRLSRANSKLKQVKGDKNQLETDLSQAKSEVEMLQLTCARTGASLESLRQQVTQLKGGAGKTHNEASSGLIQLQTDIGRLEKKLTDKDDQVKEVELKLDVAEAERESMAERISNAEAMYMDLGLQLAQTLQVDTEDSFDPDHLLAQVGATVSECEELKLHCHTLESSNTAAALDAQASRETIHRLVSENKRYCQEAEELVQVREGLEEHKAMVTAIEKERKQLEQVLVATKQMVVSLEQELRAKEDKISQLGRNLDTAKLSSDSSKSLTESVQNKLGQFVKGLGVCLSVDSIEPAALLQAIQDLIQNRSQQANKLATQMSLLEKRDLEIQMLKEASSQDQQNLEYAQDKARRMEGSLEAAELVEEGLKRDLDKSKTFCKKLAGAIGVEQETACILATGDFAHDAILMKAEQLARHESEAVVNKQTLVYSLQRKLKSCRQSVESKTLQLSLLQKKVQTLEEKLKGTGGRDAEWEAATNKMRSMERQLERLQGKVGEQRDTISQLKSDTSQLQRLKKYCQELEEEQANLIAKKEQLDLTCSRQSQQLSEVRQKVKQKNTQGSKHVEELKTELEDSRDEKEKLKQESVKFSAFRSAVHRLLSNCDTALGEKDEVPTDFELVTSLETLVGSKQRHESNIKCLEASLRQLEVGFKSGYKDALTLLGSE